MHIVVIGAGIIGVSTAYFLAKSGHQVTVIERREAPGLETSFANGGQLSYTHVDPLAGPAILPKIPSLLMGRDPSFRIKPTFDRNLLRWGMHFLRNCTSAAQAHNTHAILSLALYSQTVLHQLLNDVSCDFHYKRNGKLLCFSHQQAFDMAAAAAQQKKQWGSKQQVLDKESTLAIEPALAFSQQPLIGSLYSDIDESGDAYEFLQGLEAYCRSALSVDFLYAEDIQQLVVDKQRIVAVETQHRTINADSVVLAAGIGSIPLAKTVGISLPLYPLKGYSVTVPATSKAPATSITDMQQKVVFCRLGNKLRIAGMAELSGYDLSIDQARIETLLSAAKTALPDAGDYDKVLHKWAGFRPASADSVPIIGASPLKNLFFNTGHGMLGWTLACGSASLVAAIVNEQSPPLVQDSFAYSRF